MSLVLTDGIDNYPLRFADGDGDPSGKRLKQMMAELAYGHVYSFSNVKFKHENGDLVVRF